MKRRIFLLFLSIVMITMEMEAQDAFRLKRTRDSQAIKVKVDKTLTHDEMLCYFSERKAIAGLGISGSFTIKDDNYLIRVVLKDMKGKEHLVMESYREINDTGTVDFEDYSEETLWLDNVIPDTIKVYVYHAELMINTITLLRDMNVKTTRLEDIVEMKSKSREAQVNEIVKKINAYNRKHRKLWIAGITSIALKDYEDKKRVLGIDDKTYTGGIEYYSDGIFEIGDYNKLIENANNNRLASYVDEFDWRNRHGKNWITSIKHQGNSGYCSAYSAIGTVEALTRLYYNKLINIDLSEQEAACCNGTINPWKGMTLTAPLYYIKQYGVCDEAAYPFVNDSLQSYCRSSEITPNELVKISDYSFVSLTENSMKHTLINFGPFSSGLKYWCYNADSTTFSRNHAMTIVGYGQLHVADTVYNWIEPDGFMNGSFTVPEDDPRIGMTYWIYKNSYGDLPTDPRHGYWHIIHYDYSTSSVIPCYCRTPITTMNLTENDIVCQDSDGDGYYFWGIGEKPSWCPTWIPDTPDGDDSNENRGSQDMYGHLETLSNNTSYTINGNYTYTNRLSRYGNIIITSGSTVRVQNILNMFGRVSIYIESGGELIIDGGVITNAFISIASGGKFSVINGGKLVLRTNTEFNAPLGAIIDIQHGDIISASNFQ